MTEQTQTPTSQYVLECRDVSRTFMIGRGPFTEKRPLRAVQDISLQVRRGEVLAVVGESGCGKTTLAKMLLGLLEPTAGDILYEGVPISSVDRRDVARRIQPVFQDPYSSLNPRKTLAQIISLPLDVHKIGTPAERKARVEEIMELVGLPRRLLYSYPSQLSGGQRQRVAIARALAMKPEILVCDEPTSALDVSVQAQILNLLQELRDELNLTYVFISHNLAVVEHMSTRVAVMYLGRLIEFGMADQVFDHPRHPYTQALLDSVLTPEPQYSLPNIAMGRGFPNPLNPPSGCAFHPRCPHATELCQWAQPQPLAADGGTVECHLHSDPDAMAKSPRINEQKASAA
mgnify:CR=1 FL=1